MITHETQIQTPRPEPGPLDILVGAWSIETLTRTAADFTPLDFSRRYTGAISDDGRTITGYWESAPNDSDWRKDFDLVYRRDIDRMVPEIGQLGSTQHGGEDV
jgi:hypothetical protein